MFARHCQTTCNYIMPRSFFVVVVWFVLAWSGLVCFGLICFCLFDWLICLFSCLLACLFK